MTEQLPQTELEAAAASGMALAYHASQIPDRLAVESSAGRRTFAELNGRANQLARALRGVGVCAGAHTDDGVALLCSNRPEFTETWAATQRIGARLTPINWHLTPAEVTYIVDDCEAKVLIADARFAAAAEAARKEAPRLRQCLAVGGDIEGFDSYRSALEDEDDSDLPDPRLGLGMLYTSGTTGHPKGVLRKPTGKPASLYVEVKQSAGFRPGEDLALVTGPLYHAAPFSLNWAIPINSGVGAVLMDKWDAEETLRLIERHRITHTHMVATMFHRLLQLPEETKERYDISTLRWILHGAAPTPPHVKQRMIDWLGPVLWEYYAATEGGSYYIGSKEWLDKPGSVGRPVPETQTAILDSDGNEVAAGETGTVYFKAPEEGRFSYFKAPEKTADAYRGDYFTMGDMGYIDDDGYLFLTGRSAETIISGGVNIYPQEIDDVLNRHPAVYEVCTIGVPDDEWGESVKAVIELQPGLEANPELIAELEAFCRDNLPNFKRPRSLDFDVDLPRMATGKIQRHKVRARYWQGREI